MQKANTRCAKGALSRASGKPARFQRHTNHPPSKTIVAAPERGRCLIALEERGGIVDRVKAKRHQRARMANGGVVESRGLIGDTAARQGVAALRNDPRHTRRPGSGGGPTAKPSRPSWDDFLWIGGGGAAPADGNAARPIGRPGLRAKRFGVALEATRSTLGPEERRRLKLTVHYEI